MKWLAPAKRGEHAKVHTPEMVGDSKAGGRPVSSRKIDSRQAVTMHYSPNVLAVCKATGPGRQARMNDALRDWLDAHPPI